MGTNVPGSYGGDAVEGEEVASEESGLETGNALSLNALNLQALNLYGLHLNTLAANVLSQPAIDAIQDPGSNGDLAREFLRYAVGCAFASTQTFKFSWTDSGGTVRNETYAGGLGLAMTWAMTSLTLAQRQAVTSCLIARVNFYGTPVMLSIRGHQNGFNTPDAHELTDYTVLEGAFWGDIFGASPAVYACNHGPNIWTARAKGRDCAAGHVVDGNTVVNCGDIQIVGDCAANCEKLQPNGTYYPACRHEPQALYNSQALTVWLSP